MTNADKAELIRELKRDYDHAFLNPEGVKRFFEPFGIEYRPSYARVDLKHPKGLFVEGKRHGQEVEGMDAVDVAQIIARHLGVSYPPMMGRGFALRATADAIIAHLEKA